jgi:hypothetical protein
MNWNTHPRSPDQWTEAFLAYRRCLEALPDDGDACVTAAMISVKRKFHRQAQEVRTPSKVLLTDLDQDSDGFESITFLPPLSPFKASLDVSSPVLADRDKELARHVRLAEESLATATHNLIRQRGTLQDQDKILRGLEARLDCVQDHLGTTHLGLSSEFEAPTLNGRVALLADQSVTLDVKPTVSSISESQVLDWINNWWGAHEIQQRLRGWKPSGPSAKLF